MRPSNSGVTPFSANYG